MNDVPSIARQARANLAQALNALQQDDVPPQTQALADIVAEAMNLLHRLEKNYHNADFDRRDHSTRALLLVRNALNSLQAPQHSHPSTESVLASAAQAVGLVHQLNQLTAQGEGGASDTKASAPPAPFSQRTTAPAAPASEAPGVAQTSARSRSSTAPHTSSTAPRGASSDTPQARTSAHAAPTPIPPARATTNPTPKAKETSGAAEGVTRAGEASAEVSSKGPERASSPVNERISTNPDRLSTSPERISTNPDRLSTNPDRPSHPTALPALEPVPEEVYIEVALGAYSTSNFYTHLPDADVIDDGGLFVASYVPPELTQAVRIRATLSGGFEFEARGRVVWRREMPKSGSLNPLTPPGFGVDFTEISPDARKMVKRYVRSRAPFVRAADAP